MSEISDKHPIEGLMGSALRGLKEMIDVNTVVGQPITTPDGTVILPISKVALGFGVGGAEFPKNKKLTEGLGADEQSNLFGGGTGGGLSLTPMGFLVVGNGTIRMVPVSEENSIYDRIFDAVPVAIDKISDFFANSKKDSVNVADTQEINVDDEAFDPWDEDGYSDDLEYTE